MEYIFGPTYRSQAEPRSSSAAAVQAETASGPGSRVGLLVLIEAGGNGKEKEEGGVRRDTAGFRREWERRGGSCIVFQYRDSDAAELPSRIAATGAIAFVNRVNPDDSYDDFTT
eukprot:CAMPEP_0119503338 /NCGR_PEP_ID=MMETSP1344-20130328/24540_1 /TAXON_ID=236787 /ORGANISM="Florenciella parvula, Strain CCMP2471" /LENGTH=113 /DNA_ID=CAMNT_0007539623 /DNA_START=78 /DNA_END=416 /DNA_ORIENTATION=-